VKFGVEIVVEVEPTLGIVAASFLKGDRGTRSQLLKDTANSPTCLCEVTKQKGNAQKNLFVANGFDRRNFSDNIRWN
jgi:hypothetical protein